MKRRYTFHSSSPAGSPGLWAVRIGLILLVGAGVAAIVFFPHILLWRSQTLLAQSAELARSGDSLAAARRAEAAYRLAPENFDALRQAATRLAETDPKTARRLTLELAADSRATESDLLAALPAFSKLPPADFERLLLHFPESVRNAPEQLTRLSRGWAEAGNPEKAAAYARRSLERHSDPALALHLGTQLAANPAHETEAAKWLGQAIQTGDTEQILLAFEPLSRLSPQAVASARLEDFDAILAKLPDVSPEQTWKFRRFELGLYPNRREIILSKLEPFQTKLPRAELAEWLASLDETGRLAGWITPAEAVADSKTFPFYARALLRENRQAELIALLPSAPPAAPEIGDSLLRWQRTQKQIAPLRQLAELLLERLPGNADYLNQVAYLRFLQNELDGPWLEEVAANLGKNPADSFTRTALALGLLKSGKPSEAQEIVSAGPDPASLTDSEKAVCVGIWFANGKRQEARALLRTLQTQELLPEEKALFSRR